MARVRNKLHAAAEALGQARQQLLEALLQQASSAPCHKVSNLRAFALSVQVSNQQIAQCNTKAGLHMQIALLNAMCQRQPGFGVHSMRSRVKRPPPRPRQPKPDSAPLQLKLTPEPELPPSPDSPPPVVRRCLQACFQQLSQSCVSSDLSTRLWPAAVKLK